MALGQQAKTKEPSMKEIEKEIEKEKESKREKDEATKRNWREILKEPRPV